jgi:hypothetical protein
MNGGMSISAPGLMLDVQSARQENVKSCLNTCQKCGKSTIVTTMVTLEGTAFAQSGDKASEGDQNKGSFGQRMSMRDSQ